MLWPYAAVKNKMMDIAGNYFLLKNQQEIYQSQILMIKYCVLSDIAQVLQ